MTELGVVTPFWLDRPDTEALEVAVEADRNGFDALWIGEMVTFDAFALATAVGARTGSIPLRIGPLAATVRGPVALALGLSSVATLTGRDVGLALGASSPPIVSGWHDRPWDHAAGRMRECVRALRGILDGERGVFEGRYVRTRGFRLRSPRPGTRISIAAFGPAMTRVAAEEADELVLNLVTAEHVARTREIVDTHARDADRPPPRIAVWLPVAHDPGAATLRQLAGQLAVYLRPPGYGEMFSQLGHGALVERARAGAPRSELAAAVPAELVAAVGAVGSMTRIAGRIAEYRRAGADHVAVVPATAEDPAGAKVLAELAMEARS
ncbi:LLM class F420-dependent oxidoreductase [Pseudonocardia eucalypti]|uniref:LLM class F420-dependent oxidoreductase n=1 Tax=Pseudonocardia eucalypti TaxID=648755 RepID=A0ABP9QQ82_9PSEU|nr:putative F420-dependent oxidoreductase [Pseudonocardia eucalypti]